MYSIVYLWIWIYKAIAVMKFNIEMRKNKRNAPVMAIAREPQDCIEDKCYLWNLDHGKCKWM